MYLPSSFILRYVRAEMYMHLWLNLINKTINIQEEGEKRKKSKLFISQQNSPLPCLLLLLLRWTGAVAAQWIRQRTFSCEVPGSNLLAAAVVPLDKPFYPRCLYSVSNKRGNPDLISNLWKTKRRITKLITENDITTFHSFIWHIDHAYRLSDDCSAIIFVKHVKNCLHPSFFIVHKAVRMYLLLTLLWKLPQMLSRSTTTPTWTKPIWHVLPKLLLCSPTWPNPEWNMYQIKVD